MTGYVRILVHVISNQYWQQKLMITYLHTVCVLISNQVFCFCIDVKLMDIYKTIENWFTNVFTLFLEIDHLHDFLKNNF